MSHNLTDKQEIFCREYLVDLNATQAAIRAGYSPRSAAKQGSRMLTYTSVQQRISEHKTERVQRIQIDADWVLNETKLIYDLCKEKDDIRNCLKALDQIAKHVSIRAYDRVVPLAADSGSSGGSILVEVNNLQAKEQLEELKDKM